MCDFAKTHTLGQAYNISIDAKRSSTARLFWALDRFDFDRHELTDAGHREGRLHASQACALELDARGVSMHDPTKPIDFPRDMPA